MSALHLFIITIIILVVSLIFTLLSFIFQSRISGRILTLEKELEKKNIEVDALKKERATSAPMHANPTPAIELPSQYDMPLQQQALEEGAIQIVRNVGGVFKTAVAEPYGHAPAPANGPSSVPRSSNNTPPYTPSAGMQRPSPSRTRPEERPKSSVPDGNVGIVIPLFSTIVNGADFNNLYKTLVEAMKSRRDQLIAFDCAGIHSLNDKELEYLESLYKSLLNHKRSLVLLNCAAGLVTLIQRRPFIASIVR